MVSPWRLLTCDPRYRVWEDGHGRNWGNVTPDVVSVREGYPGDWMCDLRCSDCTVGSPCSLWMCDHRFSVLGGATLETMDV